MLTVFSCWLTDLSVNCILITVNRKYNKQNKGVWGMPVALRGEEGRDKLRKAAGIGTHELIRRYPNGATHYVEGIVLR